MQAHIQSRHRTVVRLQSYRQEQRLRALLAEVVIMAAMAGRALTGLRVAFWGAGSQNVRGLWREAGVKIRDTVMVMGRRCHIIATGAIRGGWNGGIMGWR